uniref:Uncharacterized protein n=1 Tax=Oryza brachyantha TaxID=4533 RepID=J3KV54_ORYBR
MAFGSDRERTGKERKGWSMTVHNLSGSPVAIQFAQCAGRPPAAIAFVALPSPRPSPADVDSNVAAPPAHHHRLRP